MLSFTTNVNSKISSVINFIYSRQLLLSYWEKYRRGIILGHLPIPRESLPKGKD
jgi:hypothetical protein